MLIEGVGLRVIHESGPPPVGRAAVPIGFVSNEAAGLGAARFLRVGGERTIETEVWRDVLVGIYFPEPDSVTPVPSASCCSCTAA